MRILFYVTDFRFSGKNRVKLILLDVIYNKDPLTQDMLGETQWLWLEDIFKTNQADIIFIGSGIKLNKF